MRGIVLALLGLLYIVEAKKNFRTGDVPVGFDNFSLEESNSHEGHVGEEAAQRIRGVPAPEEPSQEALQKDKEAIELARTIEWEQRKIQELKEERERVRRQKKEEIERIMKEQAVEQARIEAARAQRKRMRVLEEQRRKLMEAKRERERQEQMLVELELRKQEEIRRLEEEKEKQRKKLEEEKRRLFEEEQRRKKMEEEQRRREEEEERQRWLEEEQKRVEREQQEERSRIEREQEEARIRREEEERKILEEERKRLVEEEDRMLKEAEETERKRQAEEEADRKRQAMVEEEKRKIQEEEERKEMEEQEKRRIRKVEEEEKRRLEEVERQREIQRKRLQTQNKADVQQMKTTMEEQHENSYKTSSTKDFAELDNKMSERQHHLMARFGTQALAEHSENGKSYENNENQGNTAVQQEVGGENNSNINNSNFDEGNNEIQNSDDESQYPPPIDFGVDAPVKRRRKSKKRKIRRKLLGIKSLSTLKSKEMKNHAFEKDHTAATFLGGWTEPTDANGKEYVKVLPTTTPDPSLSKLAVVVQPIPRTESPKEAAAVPDMMANIPPMPKNFNEEEYLRQYYEQYYKEWYRQHNEANAASSHQTSLPRRQIKIQFGKPTHLIESIAPQGTLGTVQQPTTFGAFSSAPEVALQSPLVNTPAPSVLSREQLDKICADIQKTTRNFGIKDPKTFALNNCPLIKMYYKQVTCEQINHVMDYCEQGSFLA